MKELSIEEKAKLYDEAFERAKESLKDGTISSNTISYIEEIFPELAESEDERTRKALLRFHKSTIDIDGIKCEDILAWLEKQGQPFTKKDVDDAYLKGICDAKQELEKQCNQKSILDVEIPFGAKDSELQEATYCIPKGFYAEIDDDKVVIKKGEQKPTWTEEDNVFCDGIISHFEKELGDITFESECNDEQVVSDLKYCYKRNINWLKSLKDRVQPKQEWIEEDKKILDGIIANLEYLRDVANTDTLKQSFQKRIDWLKSLKDRVQPKQEWSALDERNLQGVIDEIQANKNNAPDYDLETYDRFLNWLKSLRFKKQWKPSDEQMKALQYVYRNLNPPLSDELGWNSLKTLELMCQDLKKLKKE